MINKPKYKIARRLDSRLFEKTQTQKFALRSGHRTSGKFSPRTKSEYGLQMLEKQKARYNYGIGERQFSKYVSDALKRKGANAEDLLYDRMETRLDNVIYRSQLAPTRQAARQMASHGHIIVNGVRITIPSYNLKIGDKIKIRPESAQKILFSDIKERQKDHPLPPWLFFNAEKKEGEVVGKPKLIKTELIFDISSILEFYKR